MEITVLEKTDRELRLKIKGESHTLLGNLKTYLLQDEHVRAATYNIEHPYFSDPILFIHTDGEDPIEALKKAADMLIADCNEFQRQFQDKMKT